MVFVNVDGMESSQGSSKMNTTEWDCVAAIVDGLLKNTAWTVLSAPAPASNNRYGNPPSATISNNRYGAPDTGKTSKDSQNPDEVEDIGIISPYSAQVRKIRQNLQNLSIDGEHLSTGQK